MKNLEGEAYEVLLVQNKNNNEKSSITGIIESLKKK